MSGGVTVIGLTPGSFTIEDIRIAVPYQTAVQIPAHLAQRSRNLGEAIQLQKIMQLGNALPLPAPQAKAPALAPILRGRGIAPHSPVSTQQAGVAAGSWSREREALLRELQGSKVHGEQLQGINQALQAALAQMTDKLNQIQLTLTELGSAPAREAPAGGAPASAAKQELLDEAPPHFIPATSEQAAEVRINIPETTSGSDLTDARGALRNLRNKRTP